MGCLATIFSLIITHLFIKRHISFEFKVYSISHTNRGIVLSKFVFVFSGNACRESMSESRGYIRENVPFN